jgi:hypothetical protein
MLRMLELMVIRIQKDEFLFESRLQALRVYMNRNLNKTRYAEEFMLLNCMANPSLKRNRGLILQLKDSAYYNIRLLVLLYDQNLS